MATADVARDFTAMLRQGQFAAAGERYWSDNITSVEPTALPGDPAAAVSGIAAATSRCNVRFRDVRVDDLSIDGPFVTGNQFALFIDMIVAAGAGRAGRPFAEIALYTVRGDRITEERHFHA